MKVSMAEMNKRANGVINQVARTGESATIYKHGEPIAEIRPLLPDALRKRALARLAAGPQIPVRRRVSEVIQAGRRRGV